METKAYFWKNARYFKQWINSLINKKNQNYIFLEYSKIKPMSCANVNLFVFSFQIKWNYNRKLTWFSFVYPVTITMHKPSMLVGDRAAEWFKLWGVAPYIPRHVWALISMSCLVNTGEMQRNSLSYLICMYRPKPE